MKLLGVEAKKQVRMKQGVLQGGTPTLGLLNDLIEQQLIDHENMWQVFNRGVNVDGTMLCLFVWADNFFWVSNNLQNMQLMLDDTTKAIED